jgi:hypothetical protein
MHWIASGREGRIRSDYIKIIHTAMLESLLTIEEYCGILILSIEDRFYGDFT